MGVVGLDGVSDGALGSTGSTVGGGIPGDPDGRFNGVHRTPPGPMRKVTGLLSAFKEEVVSVDTKDA